MSPKTLARLALWTAAVLAAVACLGLQRLQKDFDTQEPGLGLVPDFRLTAVDARGSTVLKNRDLLGQVWIANFIFTHAHGLEPISSANMARLQKRLPGRVRLVSFTVDPDDDTPPVLQRYAAQVWAEPGRWLFATGSFPRTTMTFRTTGSRAAVDHLIRDGFKLPLVRDPEAPDELRASPCAKFALIDRRGRVRGYYDGLDEAALAALIRDTGASLK